MSQNAQIMILLTCTDGPIPGKDKQSKGVNVLWWTLRPGSAVGLTWSCGCLAAVPTGQTCSSCCWSERHCCPATQRTRRLHRCPTTWPRGCPCPAWGPFAVDRQAWKEKGEKVTKQEFGKDIPSKQSVYNLYERSHTHKTYNKALGFFKAELKWTESRHVVPDLAVFQTFKVSLTAKCNFKWCYALGTLWLPDCTNKLHLSKSYILRLFIL